MSEIFTSEISDRICKHMNEDHADAVLLYAKAFANTKTATSAAMLRIDAQGMDLDVRGHDEATPVRITFDHDLKDAEDAHQTLIAMVKQARQQMS
jgi:putative heme iron utilization protein